jgi:hypothetical protein
MKYHADRSSVRRFRARQLLSIAVALLVCGCATEVKLGNYRTVVVQSDRYASNAVETRDYQGLPIRSGQLIVSEGGSALSFMMELMATRYGPYGHVGILSVEGNEIYVYEAFAQLGLRFWAPPTERLSGRVRKVTLSAFLKRQMISAIYEADGVDLDGVATFARQAYSQRLSFDRYFDSRTDETVYCTEFVAQALTAGGHLNIVATQRTTNVSLNRIMRWLKVDSPEFIVPADLLADAHRIVLISDRYSAAQIEARFSFKEQLHNRFTTSQKLGDIFRWTSLGPRLRPHLRQLYHTLMDEADTLENVDEWVQMRVNERLGEPLAGVQPPGPLSTNPAQRYGWL